MLRLGVKFSTSRGCVCAPDRGFSRPAGDGDGTVVPQHLPFEPILSVSLGIQVGCFYRRKLVDGPGEEGFMCISESLGDVCRGGSPSRGSRAHPRQHVPFGKPWRRDLAFCFPLGGWR